MPYNVFLKIPGIEGESVNQRHKGSIEIESFSWGGSHSGNPESGTGLAGGQASVSDLVLTMKQNKASPKILEHCCIGKPIQGGPAILTADRAGDPPIDYLVMKLHNPVISSYQLSSAGGDLPSETFSISYTKVEWGYKPLDEKGNAKGAIMAGYDLKKAEKV